MMWPSLYLQDSRYSREVSGAGKVVVKRDSGFGGSACATRIFVNGQAIADIDTAEKVVLYLPAGEQILSAWTKGLCGGGMSEVKALVKAGASSSFRVGYGSNGDFSTFPTAF